MAQDTNTGNVVDRRMALAREWDELVEQVRKLKGFEDFLRPPELKTLLPAAAKGPVVIVNVSRWRCDALIVQPSGVRACSLERLTLDEAIRRANVYLSGLRTVEIADRELLAASAATEEEPSRAAIRQEHLATMEVDRAQAAVDEMLVDLQAWMWDAIAQPVLEALGLEQMPPGSTTDWPRLWWCPTGPLTVLPLHTAGHHRESTVGDCPRTVIDRVVSSYTPTLRALLEARRSEKPSDSGPITDADTNRMLVVSVANAPNLPPLDTEVERSLLRKRFPGDSSEIVDERATHDAVRDALKKHRWVHFSCHGDQDLRNPSHGGLWLYDRMLTVADITAEQFHADFAGLSACKTAVGGVELLDEVITLAAALHYTGYRHVVATLWSVKDDASSKVFTTLYDRIAVDGSLRPDLAAAALHDAVRELREQFPKWPHTWTPFAHIGP